VTRFEFLFSLFGLLLGFILIEVLSGLVRTIRARYPTGPGQVVDIRIGWLTPVLGAFVLLDITGWWGNIWSVHASLPLGYDTMFGGVILCGIYYFAASLVFPNEPRSWPDLDTWFWLHRRIVLGCILAANVAWTPIVLSAGAFKPSLPQILIVLIYFAMLCVSIWARRRWMVIVALGFLIAQSLALAVIDFVSRTANA
jgi:hypothetical protein